MVQVAFYHGQKGWFHKLVGLFTGSTVSHCEVVIGGKGYTPIRGHSELYRRKYSEYNSEWELIDVSWDPVKTAEFIAAHTYIEYDLRSLIAHLIPFMHDSIHAQNCAEFIVNLASFCGDPRFHNRAAWRYAPSDVYKVLRG